MRGRSLLTITTTGNPLWRHLDSSRCSYVVGQRTQVRISLPHSRGPERSFADLSADGSTRAAALAALVEQDMSSLVATLAEAERTGVFDYEAILHFAKIREAAEGGCKLALRLVEVTRSKVIEFVAD